ncbi:MAG: hypothetical protein LBR26_12840 [Prevotella sp.]|nr:hypothetical protein [Prevotella sp.]
MDFSKVSKRNRKEYSIAEETGRGMIRHLNVDTLKFENVLERSCGAFAVEYFDDSCREVHNKAESRENFVRMDLS